MPKSGLGRGLGSLIPKKEEKSQATSQEKSQPSSRKSKVVDTDGENVFLIDTEKIIPNPHQPRKDFSHKELEDLIASIKKYGIIQPLIVSKVDGNYELIAGERRLRSAKVAGLKKVPAIVRTAKENEKLELALIENIQRQNLNPLEEAEAYQKLIDEFGLTQEAVAGQMGRSRSAIANSLRLLELPEKIKTAIREGKLTAGHARVILGLPNEKEQLKFLEKILKDKLSVRKAEEAGKNIVVKKHIRKTDPNIKAKEDELQAALGTKVNIKKRGDKGEIIIEYYSEEDLSNIVDRII